MRHDRLQHRARYAQKFPALARRRQPPLPLVPQDFARILLGHDASGQPLFIPNEVRKEHMCTSGTTGSGKSTYVKNQIMQDIKHGYGGILIDPHGGHPGSPYSECTARLYEDGFFDSGKIHLIDPNTRFVMPINPLARVHQTDISVVADAMLRAFEIAWGAEDTHQKPTIRTVLRSTFMALTELNLPLSHARLLYAPNDPAGLRARVISQLSNEYARDELSRIHQVALDDRSKRDFNALVLGPINRIAEFTASDAVSAMFSVVDEPGKPRRTLDLLDIMDRGDFLFVNCQHGEAFSEADASLLGAIILRYLFLLAPRRTNREPFFVTIDEAHRFMVGDDLPSLFAESRKNGIAMHVCLQFDAQAGPRDELTAQALENCTEVKTVFRVKGPEEAQRKAEGVIPLTLERPVKASIRKTVVGHRKVQLASRSSATHDAVTHGEAETEGEAYARTTSHKRSGENLKGRCPLHQGNSASFVVDENQNLWRCFSPKCEGRGGGVLELVRELEHFGDIREAALFLADMFAVKPSSDVQPRKSQRKTTMSEVSKQPTHKVYSSQKRGEGEKDWLTQIGSAWVFNTKDGREGLNILLTAMPLGERMVIFARDEEYEKKREAEKQAAANGGKFNKKK